MSFCPVPNNEQISGACVAHHRFLLHGPNHELVEGFMKSGTSAQHLTIHNIYDLCVSKLFNIFFFLLLNPNGSDALNRADKALILSLLNSPVSCSFTYVQRSGNLSY